MKRTITVEIDVNDAQLESMLPVCRAANGWRWCDVQLRIDGEFRNYEADYLRNFFWECRKQFFPEVEEEFRKIGWGAPEAKLDRRAEGE